MKIDSNFFISNPNTICPTNIKSISTNHSTVINSDELKKINSFNFTGVYSIYSKYFKEIVYIGSSVNISKRLQNHLTGLIHTTQSSNPLLRAHVEKYGIDDLEFGVIEKIEEEENEYFPAKLKYKEARHIRNLDPKFNTNTSPLLNYIGINYTNDTIPYQVYFNDKILNEFGHPIVNNFSIDYKTGYVPTREVEEIDDRRKTWKPTIIINSEDNQIYERGDITNIKTKKPVVESVVIRNNIFKPKPNT